MMLIILTAPLWLIPLLAMAYPFAVLYQRGGWCRLVAPITLIALVIDVVLNHTSLALLTWDFPKCGEWTFSQRLVRLQFDTGWRGKLARPVVLFLNHFDPNHIV